MPDGASGRARRTRVLATLEAHGLTPAAALALWRLAAELRERMLRTGHEFGAFVDADSGDLFGDVLTGTGDRLEAGSILRALTPGRRYAAIHTHPESLSFSPADGGLLVAHATRLCVVIAVGGQGTWFILSPDPDRPLQEPLAVRDAFEHQRDHLTSKYDSLVLQGELTRRDAARALTHEIWEQIATDLGLRYDRI